MDSIEKINTKEEKNNLNLTTEKQKEKTDKSNNKEEKSQKFEIQIKESNEKEKQKENNKKKIKKDKKKIKEEQAIQKNEKIDKLKKGKENEIKDEKEAEINKDEINQKINLEPKDIVDNESFKKINNWINPSKDLKFELIYKASKNGDNAKNFHQNCDGKHPTVTIIKSKNGHTFGGYLSVPFFSDGESFLDESAFLFSLTNNKKFNIRNKEPAVLNDGLSGPNFGKKDLEISSECLNKFSYCKPSSFTFKRANLIGINDKCFKVEDYEVYLVNK